MMKVVTIFPTLIIINELDNFKEIENDLIDFTYEERSKDNKGVSVSNIGGWHSKPHYSSYENILSSVILQGINKTLGSSNVFKSNTKIKILNLWVNINQKGNLNSKHLHPRSDLSGVFWIKAPKNSGNLRLYSPHTYDHAAQIQYFSEEFKNKAQIKASYEINPSAGSLILFPSSIYHDVAISRSDEDRISCAFNIKIS